MPETITLADRVPASPTPETPWPARELVGRSAAIARVQDLVRRAALADGGVLLLAPRGTDVESVARDLHDRASASGAFERVDCAAADPARLERLLFGAAPALIPTDLEWAAKDSLIAAARGGTVFLQDVTELPASVQARLARVARDGEVRIDGGPVTTRIRWMASAAAGSERAPGIDGDVQAGRFRGDLYRRLAASRIDLPPLRDRAEDVPAACRCACSRSGARREGAGLGRSRSRRSRCCRRSPGRAIWPSCSWSSSAPRATPRTT